MHCCPAEYKAWKIYRSLDVDYVFVVFGGLVGYSSDDVNKFLWMVRIGGGVYPEIKESDYLGNGVCVVKENMCLQHFVIAQGWLTE